MMQKRSACVRGEKCHPLTDKSRLNCVVFHDPDLMPEEIADKAGIQFWRLKNYASESQPSDWIPFRSLLRVCDVTGRWDLIDASLNQYHRGITEFTAKPSADVLNESIDVNTVAARLLDRIREMSRDGRLDANDRAQARDLLRILRAEVEQVDVSLDAPATPISLVK